MDRIDTTAAVVTPERVRLNQRLAGPGRRAVAWTVDATIRMVVVLVAGIIALFSAAIPGLAGVGMGTLLVVLFVLEWVYGVFFETLMAGRTPGKLLLGLRVVQQDGAPARFSSILLRNLLRAVDYLPGFFAIGVLVMAADSRMRRVGDLVGSTVVVVEERGRVGQSVLIEPPITEEERRAMPAGVSLTAEEVRVIEDFLWRRPRLSEGRAEELAALYGPALSERTGVQAPTWTRVLTLAYARATGRDR